MAVTAFANDIHTKMNNIQGDLLAKDATWDGSAVLLEACQFTTLLYVVVKAIRALQVSSNDRNRFIGARIGPHTEYAIMGLASMWKKVYQELRAAANDVDTPETDDPWDTDYLTRGTGPQGGPIH
jgi:hypothetical protein